MLCTRPTVIQLAVIQCDVTSYQLHTSHGKNGCTIAVHLKKHHRFLSRSVNALYGSVGVHLSIGGYMRYQGPSNRCYSTFLQLSLRPQHLHIIHYCSDKIQSTQSIVLMLSYVRFKMIFPSGELYVYVWRVCLYTFLLLNWLIGSG